MSQSLIRDRLKVDYNFAYTTGKGSYADKFIMRQAVLRNPTEPIYETSGNNPQYGKYFFSPGIDYHNPVAMLEQRDDEGIRKEFSGSVNASLRIIDGLKISAMGAIIERSERYGHYYGRYYPVNIGNNGTAKLTTTTTRTRCSKRRSIIRHVRRTTNCKPSPVTRSARKVRKATTR